MSAGLGSRVSKIGQLRAGDHGAGVLANQIRSGLVIDADTIPPPLIQTAVQAISFSVLADGDVVLSPSLAFQVVPPLVVDADTVTGPRLDMSVVAALVSDQDTILSHQVGAGGVAIASATIVDADAVASPLAAPGAVAVLTTPVVDADAVLSPAVANDTGQSITLPATADDDTVTSPALALNVLAPLLIDSDIVISPALAQSLAAQVVVDADTVNGPRLDMGIAPAVTVDADTVSGPALAMNLAPSLTVDADTVLSPAVAAAAAGADVALLDAWTDQGTGVSLVDPGSRSISAGTDRLLVIRTATASGATVAITAVTWGGQALTLIDQRTSTGGRNMHTALWYLDDADIDAGSSDDIEVTPNSGTTQFRLQSGVYENVDQANPIVDSQDQASVAAGDEAIPVAMATDDGGVVIAGTGINRGTADAGTEDMAYANLTERVENNTSSQQYASVADADTDGTNFTPDLTSTQTNGRVHLLAASLRRA